MLWLTWPDSVRAHDRARVRLEPDVVLKVRAKSIELMRQGLAVLTSWNEARNGGKFVTVADLETIQAALKVASNIGVDSKAEAAFHKILTTDKRFILADDLQEAIRGLNQIVAHSDFERNHVSDDPKCRSWFSSLFASKGCDPARPHLTMAKLTPGELTVAEALLSQSDQTALTAWSGSEELDSYVRIACFGAIGAALRAVMSIMLYWGSQRFLTRWFGFYMIRPVEGAVLSLALYLVLLVGGSTSATTPKDGSTNATPLVSATTVSTATSHAPESLPGRGNYALALMVGLFVGEAKKKLQTIAGGLFENARNEDHIDDVDPIIHAMRPVMGPSFWAGSFEASDVGSILGRLRGLGPGNPLFQKLSMQTQVGIIQNPNLDASRAVDVLVAAFNELLTGDPLLDKSSVGQGFVSKIPADTAELFKNLPGKATQAVIRKANVKLLLDLFAAEVKAPDSWQVDLLGVGFGSGLSVTLDGKPLVSPDEVKYKNSGEFSLLLRGPKYASAKTISVIVVNPAAGQHSDPYKVELPGTGTESERS